MDEKSADKKVVEDIVARAKAGEREAFASLYEMHYDRIYRYVAFKCGGAGDAEDLTGEVFLKMLESIHQFEFRGFPFTSWLYRIAHNVVMDHFRRRGRRPTVPLDDAERVADAAHSEMEWRAHVSWTMNEVVNAMDDLTDLQREVVSLRFAGGLSIAETAKAVGRKENAVKALQHAGIKKLRAALAPSPPKGDKRGGEERRERSEERVRGRSQPLFGKG